MSRAAQYNRANPGSANQPTGRQQAYQSANSSPAPAPVHHAPAFDWAAYNQKQEAILAQQRAEHQRRMEELNRVAGIRGEIGTLLGNRSQFRQQLPDVVVSEYKARKALEDAKDQAARLKAGRATGGASGDFDLSPYESKYEEASKALEQIQSQVSNLTSSILGKAGSIGEGQNYESMFGSESSFDPEEILGRGEEAAAPVEAAPTAAVTGGTAVTGATPGGLGISQLLAGAGQGLGLTGQQDSNGRKATNRIF